MLKKIFIFVICIIIALPFSACGSSNKSASTEKTEGTQLLKNNVSSTQDTDSQTAKSLEILPGVSHMVQSTVRIEGDKVVYFDPISIEGEPHDADIIFVTHTHEDHFSLPDIQKVMKEGTTLIIVSDGVQMSKDGEVKKILEVIPQKEYEVDGIKFKTVPAYNIDNGYHLKESNWVGYIINMKNTSYYVAGDTDLIDEMKDIKVDVAFLPIGGTYTMDVTQAAQAANIIKPKIAVPIHFGYVVGSREDANKFVSLLDKSIKGIILQK